MKRFTLASLLLLALSACNSAKVAEPPMTETAKKPDLPTGEIVTSDEGHRASTATQPVDQPKNPTDEEISENIRKQMMDSTMAENLANVKLSTRDGKVKLTGIVKTIEEKEAAEKIAQSAAGDNNVWSELEVEQ